MIIAMVPRPAVLGMASGTKAIFVPWFGLQLFRICSSLQAIHALFVPENSMRKPIKATISPPGDTQARDGDPEGIHHQLTGVVSHHHDGEITYTEAIID